MTLLNLLHVDCPRSCELYHNGSDICFKYGSIGNDYVYVDDDVDTIDNLNSKLVELNNTLHSHINNISQINSTSEINSTLECVQIILGLMCHHSFPLCDYSSNTPVPREVCVLIIINHDSGNSVDRPGFTWLQQKCILCNHPSVIFYRKATLRQNTLVLL